MRKTRRVFVSTVKVKSEFAKRENGEIVKTRELRFCLSYLHRIQTLLIIQLQEAEYRRDGIREGVGLLLDPGKYVLVDFDNIC